MIQTGPYSDDQFPGTWLIGNPFSPVQRQIAEKYFIQYHVVAPGIAIIIFQIGGSRPSFVLDALPIELYRNDLF